MTHPLARIKKDCLDISSLHMFLYGQNYGVCKMCNDSLTSQKQFQISALAETPSFKNAVEIGIIGALHPVVAVDAYRSLSGMKDEIPQFIEDRIDTLQAHYETDLAQLSEDMKQGKVPESFEGPVRKFC